MRISDWSSDVCSSDLPPLISMVDQPAALSTLRGTPAMTQLRDNPISPTVDFDKDGVQHGFLRLPYSRDDSAWGAVMIPITAAKSGAGPTVLLTGGNPGAEYQGPIALFEPAQSLSAAELAGRAIVVPAVTHPASRAPPTTDGGAGGKE